MVRLSVASDRPTEVEASLAEMDRERHRPIYRRRLGQRGPDGHAAVHEGDEQTPGELIAVRPRPVADRGPSAGHRSAQSAPYARVTLSSAAVTSSTSAVVIPA